MGEVRDASLRKDLVCHCEKCVRELKARAHIRQAQPSNPIRDALGDVFDMKGW